MYDAQAQAKIFTSRGKPIHRRSGKGIRVEVLQHESLRWMRFGDTDVQSAMDVSLPWYPLAAYSQAMLAALCLRPLPQRVLVLGLGGGSLERFFAEKLPAVQIVSVEAHPVVTDLAFDYFDLPATTTIVEMSGQKYVEKIGEPQDLIFVDMFDANGHLPCLTQQVFHQQVAANLTTDGMMLVNALATTEAELLTLLLAIRPVFPHVLFAQEPASQNVVLLCSSKPLPPIAQAKQRARELLPSLAVDFLPALSGCTALPKPEYP